MLSLSAKQAKQLAKTVYVQLRQSKCLEPVPDLVTAVFKGLCVITISGSEVDDPLAGAERKTRFLILLIGCHLASILSKLTTEA